MPYSMKFAKKSEDQNKISKHEGYFFGQHPLVEKTPTATDMYMLICIKQRTTSLISLYESTTLLLSPTLGKNKNIFNFKFIYNKVHLNNHANLIHFNIYRLLILYRPSVFKKIFPVFESLLFLFSFEF